MANMKFKSVSLGTVSVMVFLIAIYFLTVEIYMPDSAPEDERITIYDINELSWDEIIQKGKDEGSVSFATWWADAYF